MTFDVNEARFIIEQLKKEWTDKVVYVGEIKLTKNNTDHCVFVCSICQEQRKLMYTQYGLFEGRCYSCDKTYIGMAVPFSPHIDIAYSYFRFFYPQLFPANCIKG